MKTYFRFLSRNKLYTVVMAVGLSVSLAFVILLSSYIVDDMSCDIVLEDMENVYLVVEENSPYSFEQNDNYLNYPEVTQRCRVQFPKTQIIGDIAHLKCKGEDMAVSVMPADNNFFEFFTLPLIYGAKEEVLASKNNIVISEKVANTFFPDENPVGKTIRLFSEGFVDKDYIIGGVYKDFPKTTLRQGDVIIHIEEYNETLRIATSGSMGSSQFAFLKLVNNADLSELAQKLTADYCKGVRLKLPSREMGLIKFSQIREQQDRSFQGAFDNMKNGKILDTYMIICAFLVLASLFNYIALTIAFSRLRMKEFATRQLLGTEKRGIVLRCIVEAFVLLTAFYLIAVLIAMGLNNYVGAILGVTLNPMQHLNEYLLLSGIIIIMGLIAGIIPSLFAIRHNPIQVIKGEERFKDKMFLSKALVCFEGILSIFSIAVCIAIFLQTTLLINEPRGYNTDGLVYVEFNSEEDKRYADELQRESYVERVGHISTFPVLSWIMTSFSDSNENNYETTYLSTDQAAADMMGFTVTDHNKTLNTGLHNGYMYLTATSMEKYSSIILDNALWHRWGTFVEACYLSGTVNDFKFGTLKHAPNGENIVGLNIIPDENIEHLGSMDLMVQVSGSTNEAARKIEEFYTAKGYDSHNVIVRSANGIIEDAYKEELNLKRLLDIFAIISIIITALAITALGNYYTQVNARSTAIYKVCGESQGTVFWKTVWGFFAPVLLASFVAIPLAYMYIHRWLQEYPLRIDNTPYIYLGAVAVVLVIVLIAIAFHAYSLMRTNPAKVLKKE